MAQLNITISDDTMKRAKIAATMAEKPVKDWVADLIRQHTPPIREMKLKEPAR